MVQPSLEHATFQNSHLQDLLPSAGMICGLNNHMLDVEVNGFFRDDGGGDRPIERVPGASSASLRSVAGIAVKASF